MKELSIEEKAKRYDEAIKTTRKWYNANTNEGYRGIFEDIFPELKESDDERIRKEIIAFLTYYHTGQGNSVKYDDGWIAWLEKQGEQKPVISYDALREGIGYFGITQYQIDNWLKKYVDVEKQGEQKPIDTKNLETAISNMLKVYSHIILHRSLTQDELNETDVYAAENTKNLLCFLEQKPADKVEPKKEDTSKLTPFEAELFSMMSDAWQGYLRGEEVNITKIVKEHSSELLERANGQKPTEWSEEDERFLNVAINILNSSKVYTKSPGKYEDTINWLKSLRPQLQQKWSEKDERVRIALFLFVEAYGSYANYEVTQEEMLSWLKSLRPQSTWKPSDEQMDALEKECIAHSNYGLCRLLEQLKKLRKE